MEQADAPPWFWTILEAPRALSEATSLIPAHNMLTGLAPGDGHAVMALPGFLASDRSTAVLRRYLLEWGYDASRWELGRNLGVTRDRGTPGRDEITIRLPVDISDRRSASTRDEAWPSTNVAPRAHGAVDAPWKEFTGALVELAGECGRHGAVYRVANEADELTLDAARGQRDARDTARSEISLASPRQRV